ncbi:phosphatidylserine decarboxylase-domain-containing protein [Gamsiella multidivaricata]|uniref:phosphatidylserine decarboxylase-domain-containing protein n=1 Tax=Gamsiella multidivaricata TaxID=101098 RepID=UPI00221F8838|nr:phosphatidylserine decarboxylase-domain-containing protein [Gamsiella multidivaricata]KAI7818509.1 phosphatidylserine decarboxylase-domain-containing protein [Gamsiella multidivaricata]
MPAALSDQYPLTIDAKFVKEQTKDHNVHGLRHALSASVEKSSAAEEPGSIFEGGILTSANQKKWYHAALPINWTQKISSEHHFGNYVISNRETGTKIWEDMPIYARIGMHILFACMFDHELLETHRIHHLFLVESVNQGKHFDAPESVAQIGHFIKTYKLDLSELLQPDPMKYSSFNEFFYRKLRLDARPIKEPENPNVIVSSTDCRLCVFDSIQAATQIWIKGKSFSVQQLLRDDALAAEFEGGSIALFRLAPQDYHRFHSPVTGTVAKEPVKIDGTYFTVNPMAVNEKLDVFTENVRRITVIDLEQQIQGEEVRNDNFDKCVFVSIGALLVGSIQLTGAKEPGTRVQKGDELGYFAYGGSTCILLFKAGAVGFDKDLLENSQKGLETLVRMGEHIGVRL